MEKEFYIAYEYSFIKMRNKRRLTMGLFKSVSSDMLNTQLEKIEEAVKTAESATGQFCL
mgnify:CR=1 FL=1